MNTPVTEVPGIGPHMAGCLAEHNISTAEDLATASLAVLVKVKGLGPVRATHISKAAQATIAARAIPLPNGKAVVSEPIEIAAEVKVSKGGQEVSKAKKTKKDKKSKKEKKEQKAKKAKNKTKKIVKKTKKKDAKKSKKVTKNKKKDVKKPKKAAKKKKKDKKKKSKKKNKKK